jgi:glycerol-3-phosphate dehydrogenase (NAD+)
MSEAAAAAATKKKKCVVFGSGSFGTALAYKAAVKGEYDVVILSRSEEVCRGINEDRKNPKYLLNAQYQFPANVSASSDAAAALADCEIIIHCVPVQSSFDFLAEKKHLIGKDVLIVSASKGIHSDTLQFMSDIIPAALGNPDQPLAFFSFPSFAKEMCENVPTLVTVAAKTEALARRVQDVFHHPALRIYTSDDVIGVELAGALKNVFAIAAGVCDALGFGLNTQAALVTRGCSEMMRLAIELGAQPITLSGLSGVGDLMLTCYGALSRNRTVGQRLGRGETIEQIKSTSLEVAEGVATTPAAAKLARKIGIDVPIVFAIEQLLEGGQDPRTLVRKLLERPPQHEHAVHRLSSQNRDEA